MRSTLLVKYVLPKKKLYSLAIMLFSFFWNSKCFALFAVICLLKLVILLSKSVLITKLDCFDIAVKFSAVNLLYSAVLYLAWSGILFSASLIVVFKTVVVLNHLYLVFFYQHLQLFFSKFCLSVSYWFVWISAVASGIFF